MSVLSLPKRLAAAVAVFGLFGAGGASAVTGTSVRPDQQPVQVRDHVGTARPHDDRAGRP